MTTVAFGSESVNTPLRPVRKRKVFEFFKYLPKSSFLLREKHIVLFQVLALIGFIATLATYFPGNGFVAWVTISTFIVTVVLFILKVLNIISRLPGYWELYVSTNIHARVWK